MPIKTIQPFVSNFNAFAGEGFYGNVVQGLVIKQLEDAVFIFGIAIDGTLIFRKRNYPDVSTWEDPKIIIHSNNWHKIYFVTDLGGLLPLATNETKGLASMNMCIAYVGEGPVICIKPTNLKTYYYTLLTVTVYENGKFKKIDLAVYNPAKGKGHKCSILGDGNVFVKEDSDYNLYIYNASLNNATYCVSIIGCTKNINLQSITVEGSPASVLNGLILNDVATM